MKSKLQPTPTFLIEPLEHRRLLSLVIDVRAGDGSTSAAVSSVGQVLNLQLVAVVTGQNGDPSQDDVLDVIGSIIGTNVGFGPVKGNLSADNLSPFTDNGSQRGVVQDVNNDGNLDVGGPDDGPFANFFDARKGSRSTGTAVGPSAEYEIGLITYTVTDLHYGGEVDLAFAPWMPPSALNRSADWFEDNGFKDETTGTFSGGTPFKITAPSAVPVGPVAQDDSFSAVSGIPDTVNVLQNDFDVTGTIVPTTVAVESQPNQGGTATVNHNTGQITYTADPNFVGVETFTYTVRDDNAFKSKPGTVTFTVAAPIIPVPVASDDAATAVLATPTTIAVATNDTAVAPATLDLASIVVAASPTNGTATAQSDGSVLYTPSAGFIGTDSFTYTINDSAGLSSNTATVNVNVGVAVTHTRGGHPLVTYTDADATVARVTLNRGTAELHFNGSGTATVAKSGAVTIANGNSLTLSDISLTGTSIASALSITGRGGDGVVSLDHVTSTDGGAVGRIVGKIVNLTGDILVGGLNTLMLGGVSGSQIQVGALGTPTTSFTLGNVNASSITSAVPIRLLSVATWTDASSTITAPSLVTLLAKGDFASAMTLTGNGSSPVPTLGAVRVVGRLGSGAWSITGSARSINAGSVDPAWSGNITGTLNAFTVRGDLAANLTTGGIGFLTVLGDLTDTITTGSAKLIHVTGTIRNGAITSTGDIFSIVAGSITSSLITAGVPVGETLDSVATSTDLGVNTIRGVRLTSRVGNAFSDSTILAHQITSASLGTVATANTTPTGLAASILKSVSLTAGGIAVHIGAKQLDSTVDLMDFLTKKAVVFGDFQIKIVA